MQFAIIAAGKGSRLAYEGATLPKPLVPLLGVSMVERLLSIYTECGADKIAIIVNQDNRSVFQRLQELAGKYNLDICVRNTPSSMHSFYELSELLDSEKFCLSTVDTVFSTARFKAYIEEFRNSDNVDALMAVTSYIDDEKPLYVQTDNEMNITGYYDMQSDCRYVSAGIYCLTDKCLDVLKECIENGLSRMRAFQRQLVLNGMRVKAFDIGKVIDVDHLEDVAKAEILISEEL